MGFLQRLIAALLLNLAGSTFLQEKLILNIQKNCDYDVFYYTNREEMEPILITVRELIELIVERIFSP